MKSTWQPGVKTIPPTGLVIWLSMQRFWSPLWVDRSDSHWSCVHHLGFSSYCADVVTTGGCHVTIVIYVISEGLSSDAHIKSAIHWQLSLDLHKMSYLELGYSADPHRESVQKTNWWFDWEKAPDFYWVLSSHSDREIVPPHFWFSSACSKRSGYDHWQASQGQHWRSIHTEKQLDDPHLGLSTEGHHKILFKSCHLSPTENNFIITKGNALTFTHCCTVCPKSLATTQGHNQVAFKDFVLGVKDCFCLGTSEGYLLGIVGLHQLRSC